MAFEVLIYNKFVGHIHGSWLIWMVGDLYIWFVTQVLEREWPLKFRLESLPVVLNQV